MPKSNGWRKRTRKTPRPAKPAGPAQLSGFLKTPVNAKFDVDAADWFKAQGRGYQTRMNAVLRRYMDAHRKAG